MRQHQTENQSKQMFTVLNRHAVLYLILIGQNNYFRQIPDQPAALREDGQ